MLDDPSLWVFIVIIILALGFGVVNGFNDAANAIATVIGTRTLSPRNAIIMAAFFNLAGAATGTAVAKTIGKGILIPEAISRETVIAALAAVIIWTTLATYRGLPVSLTHGFVAAMAAAGIAAAGTGAVDWDVMAKVASAVISAPVLGFIGGFILMVLLMWIFRKSIPAKVRNIFSNAQIVSAAFMAYSHGKNDGQMPMGIMVMALVIFYDDPSLWERLSLFNADTWWIIIIAALSISFGTAIGGWRVIKTIGMRVTTLRPVHGFAAQTAAASVIEMASYFGIPVSTTHCISTSVMGVGATRRLSAVRWGVAGNIMIAWVLTFPICGILGYLFSLLLGLI
ncbi:MAG: inorganic phosphate transporter [Dehalococcoidia bacterium]|nr:MAG: inorganic phosphate transporter [Dehalococcoidia bacterium]